MISARLPRRLETSYAWNHADRTVLREASCPARDGANHRPDPSTIVHAVIDTPRELRDVLTRWGDRGPAVVVEAASCLIARGWQADWFDSLRAGDAFEPGRV